MFLGNAKIKIEEKLITYMDATRLDLPNVTNK